MKGAETILAIQIQNKYIHVSSIFALTKHPYKYTVTAGS